MGFGPGANAGGRALATPAAARLPPGAPVPRRPAYAGTAPLSSSARSQEAEVRAVSSR
jgi:hypothetical protein